jgi:DNA-binding MarR family transcriptional regulator
MTRLNGRDINVAANATRAILTSVLHAEGLVFVQWAVLNNLPADENLTREELSGRLVALGVADSEAIAKAVDDLHASDLLATGEHGFLSLTEQGNAVVERVSATSTKLGDQLYDGMDAEDLATTKRVLETITDRAQKLAGSGS